MGTHVDTVLTQLTIAASGDVYRNGNKTAWTIVSKGRNKWRGINRNGGIIDDKTSVSPRAELQRIAECIAADECE